MDPALKRTLDDLDRDRFNANVDDHFDRYLREREQEFDANRPEAIRQAVWGEPRRGGEGSAG